MGSPGETWGDLCRCDGFSYMTMFQALFIKTEVSHTASFRAFIETGEVPGLHSQEELEPLLSPLKEQMREDGNHKTTYDFFVSRVQKNLHVVLCMVRQPIFYFGDAQLELHHVVHSRLSLALSVIHYSVVVAT